MSLKNKEGILNSKPLRNPTLKVSEKNGEVFITLERKQGGWVNILSKIFFMPKEKTVVLDKIGSEIWNLCDGRRRVCDIVNYIVENHKLSNIEAETSLLEYLKQLVKRGIIGLEISKKYL
ncbi:MAG: PqqD family protein [Candidatus Firestonebacteria bacterium]